MTADPLGEDYVAQAGRHLRHGREAWEEGTYADAVRFAQAATELALKASLRWAGVEYPRVHDIAAVLLARADGFPPWYRERIADLADLSQRLGRARGIATYGLELEGRPPSSLFTDRAATHRLLERAGEAHALAERLLRLRRPSSAPRQGRTRASRRRS